MEPMQIPTLIAGLIDCVNQLITLAEELLELISQEQEAAYAQENGEAEVAGEGASAPDHDSLQDLAEFSDLESILSIEDEILANGMNESIIGICEDFLPGVDDEEDSN